MNYTKEKNHIQKLLSEYTTAISRVAAWQRVTNEPPPQWLVAPAKDARKQIDEYREKLDLLRNAIGNALPVLPE